ncbi:hypothetical protein MRB53_041803 [Persea americana]|nr:hypothetical protein MRB53_041803 [Persea americana]
MSGVDDTEAGRRNYRQPYTSKHPVPTVQQYRQFKDKQQAELSDGDDDAGQSYGDRARDKWASYRGHDTTNGDVQAPTQDQDSEEAHAGRVETNDDVENGAKPQEEGMEDTSQLPANTHDPKERRKQLKHRGKERAKREVTDPITHLPITIHDFTDKDLEEEGRSDDDDLDAPPKRANTAESGRSRRDTTKGLQEQGKSTTGLEHTTSEGDEVHKGLEDKFPPPDFDEARGELGRIYRLAFTWGLLIIASLSAGGVVLTTVVIRMGGGYLAATLAASVALVGVGSSFLAIWTLRTWTENRVKEVWEDRVWDAQHAKSKEIARSMRPESSQWFNMLIGSIWPLVNPDLFASMADMLEDVMQASLPKFVRMVAVEDLGQGSESIRILGIKWLRRGAAGQSVTEDGTIKKKQDGQQQVKGSAEKDVENEKTGTTDAGTDQNDRSTQAEDEDKQKGEESAVVQGMEAEEGDFINFEIAFAYRASHKSRKTRDRAKNAHMYMAFYLPGSIRLRKSAMPLTPDPPFLSLCTVTLLGQPKVDMACVPLVKKGLNIMDLPLISNFVQSAVDAAMSEYVAPKSITLDLKAMLAGDDFKNDTLARGIIIVTLKRAFDFKAGDAGIPLLRDASSDAYVSVGWAKFGKPLFSTRVIVSDMEPYWNETAYVLVSPEELDAEESLRLQLWDSDRTSADDDLGRIELDLKTLMKSKETNGKFHDRIDAFRALKAGEEMPGRLEWSVGYFSKTRLLEYQIEAHLKDKKYESVNDLKKEVEEAARKKLSETARDETAEIEQQQKQDWNEKQIELINTSPPPDEYPMGILSIQIHQIVGLGITPMHEQSRNNEEGETDEEINEDADDLPDSYCNIILNHTKIYKTRTKPRSANPYFNAGSERFIRDWRTTSVIVSCRDSRVHEDHPLIGVVNIDIAELFRTNKCSRYNGWWPLFGGVGYGRVRISFVFRSIQTHPPPNALGWDYGTIVVAPKVTSSDLDSSLSRYRLKFRTRLSKAKMHQSSDSHHGGTIAWKSHKPLKLAMRNRHGRCLVMELRSPSSALIPMPTINRKAAHFAVLWLNQIPDEEEQSLQLPVFRGDVNRAAANTLPDKLLGERVGTLNLKVTFKRGLSPAHYRLARKNPDVGNVLEVLECIRDQQEEDEAYEDTGSDSDSSDGDSDAEPAPKSHAVADADQDVSPHADNHKHSHSLSLGHRDRSPHSARSLAETESNSGGFINDAKAYLRHKDSLHRKGRGAMQWKGPRTMAWMKHKVEHIAANVEEKFSHKERAPGVETEI